MSNGHRGPGRPRKSDALGGPQAGLQAPALIERAKESIPEPHPERTASRARAADEACGRCIFFHPVAKPPKAGSCRRYPPVPGFGDFVHPVVLESSWCGEFDKGAPPIVVVSAASSEMGIAAPAATESAK